MEKVGKWAFILGLLIAVVAGFGYTQPWFGWVLCILGLIVGFLNVTGEETHGFLLAAIALMVASTGIAEIPFVGEQARAILANLILFIGAAALVVALKTLFATARD